VKGWLPAAGGLLAVVLGALWTLQGLNLVGGSPMSGVTIWAIVGPIVAVIGLVLIVIGVRARNAAADQPRDTDPPPTA
jgi:hypothetical protein